MPNFGEIGQAGIRIVADGRDFESGLQRDLPGAAQRGGSKFSSILGTTLKRGAQVAGAGVATVMGIALTKGFSRLSQIDQAQKKLEGLGHSAGTVKTVMNNALASVKGTAFGLGEAATLSAGLIAAGIKPGQALERTLKRVADTATIAGSDLNEMGAIWGSVAAKGRLQGDELAQLSERGVPVLQWLAKHYGVTAAAASKMVSQGKVDFTTFQTVMEKNLGGAAMSSGETFVGSMANVGAALSRLGAGLMGGVFSQMPGLFSTLIAWIDKVTPKAKEVGEQIGRVFARVWKGAQALITLFAKGDFTAAFREAFGVEEDAPIVGTLLRIRDAVIGLFQIIVHGDFTGAFARAFNVEEDSPVVGVILRIRDAVVGLFQLIGRGDFTGSFRRAFGVEEDSPIVDVLLRVREHLPAIMAGFVGLAPVLGKVVGHFGGFKGILSKMGPLIKTALTSPLGLAVGGIALLGAGLFQISKDGGAGFTKMLQDVAGKVTQFAGMLPGIVTSIAAALPGIMDKILPVVVKVFETLAKVLPQLVTTLVTVIVKLAPVFLDAAITLFMALVKAATQILPVLIKGVIDLIKALVGMLPTLIPMLVNAGVTLFLGIVAALPKIVPALIDGAIAVITSLVTMLPTLIPILVKAAVALFLAIVDALPKIIPALIAGGAAIIWALIKSLPVLVPALFKGALALFMAIVQAVPEIWNALWKALEDIGKKINKWMSDTWSGFLKSAKEWFTKIGQGIAGVWNNLVTWLSGPINTALEWIQKNLIDKFNALMKSLGIGLRIGRIWAGNISGAAAAAAAASSGTFGGGGYTGSGDPRKPAGVVHGREWVLNAKSTAALLRDYGRGFLESLNGYATGGWVSPVNARITFPYGARYRDGSMHHGVDYSVPTGTLVRAPGAGRIVRADWDTGGFGRHIRMSHASGLFSILGHLQSWLVKAGQNVAAGQAVARSDNTGRSTGPHLHWEVRRALYSLASSVNPFSVGPVSGTKGAIQTFVADQIRNAIAAIGRAADWLTSLGPMGALVGGIGKKFLTGLGEKALDLLGFGENGGGLGGSNLRLASFDQGGILRPGLTMAWNGTGRDEAVVPAGGYGPITVNMNVSIDDLAKMTKISDFLEMLDRARVTARRTERSGVVSA